MRTAILLAGLIAGLAAPALAADVTKGEWLRDTGASHVRFVKCGDALCGVISWLRDANAPAKVGQKVFFDMKPAGENRWSGKAFNPEDGKTYDGKMTLSGKTLVTEGCAMMGLICKKSSWTLL